METGQDDAELKKKKKKKKKKALDTDEFIRQAQEVEE
jgi:hypothetical protein